MSKSGAVQLVRCCSCAFYLTKSADSRKIEKPDFSKTKMQKLIYI